MHLHLHLLALWHCHPRRMTPLLLPLLRPPLLPPLLQAHGCATRMLLLAGH